MVNKLSHEKLIEQAIVYGKPPTVTDQYPVNRTFELPARIYGLTVAGYLGFLGLMAITFAQPGLAIPMAIFVVVIAGAFGLPTIWTRMAPGSRVDAMSWARFQRDGISTLSGHLTAAEATAQVLVLPTLILVWGMAVTTIAVIVA